MLLSCVIVGVLAAVPGGMPSASVSSKAAETATAPSSEADVQFFESRVRPILAARCYECHAAKTGKSKGSLQLDSRAAILAGGDSGPAAEPGDMGSLLLEAVGYTIDGMQMPPTGKLPAGEIAILKQWVERGLAFPASEPSSGSAAPTGTAAKKGIDVDAGRKHWSFQPLARRAAPPAAADPWCRSEIDGFVLAEMRKHGLSPSPEADPRTLVRRAKFDLLGLPPSIDEVEAFAADARAVGLEKAYAALVDRYLASPHYGERWGRSWLDMARYCDVPESWREGEGAPWLYRDWVVAALNADMPYDRFVRMQFAADLLPGAQPADNAALGFLGLSPTYWKELKLDHVVIKQVVADEWEERIDAVGQTFLGLTIACARCHDHKYDPISQHDYYGLAGVLASIRQEDRPLIDAVPAAVAKQARDQVRKLEAELAELKKPPAPMPAVPKPAAASAQTAAKTNAAKKDTDKNNAAVKPDEAKPDPAVRMAEIERKIAELKRTPFYDRPVACGISDAATLVLPDGEHRTKIEYRPATAQNVAMHVRGNPGNPGAEVPRRFPAVLAVDRKATFGRGSGRLDLADAIVGDARGTAARVMVNRVWAGHFGRGLVATPSNFGTRGSAPSHPELLEDLTARFVESGWSLKRLHRELMLSATYRQASFHESVGAVNSTIGKRAVDPDNVYLSRMTPRRLDVEAWRDAMLVAAGDWDSKIGGPPTVLTDGANRRRTLYGTVKRRDLDEMLRLNDFPDPVVHAEKREPTTTPLQQLFALNNPLPESRSAALVARLEREKVSDPQARVERLHAWLFARRPAADEAAIGREFVAATRTAGASDAEAWRRYAHALLVSNEFLFVD
jgi:hypothetical protein